MTNVVAPARRDALIVALAIAAAWLATPWARMGWTMVVVPRSFATSIRWLDYAYLTLWAFELVWAALFGFVLTRSLRSPNRFGWSLLFGIGLGLLHFGASSNRFGAEAPLSMYVWAYGLYFVPVVGAAAGHRLGEGLGPKEHDSLRDAA